MRLLTRAQILLVCVIALSHAALILAAWDPERVPKGAQVEAGGSTNPLDYAQRWRPFRLFSNLASILIPWTDSEVLNLPAGSGQVTGLTSAPHSAGVVYAFTDGERSRLLKLSTPADRTLVADTADLGEDLWFHGPLSLSPDSRWMLAVTSARRETPPGNEAGDVWLLDLSKSNAPRRVLSAVRLVHVTWAPSGENCVCQVEEADGAHPRAVVLQAESANVLPLADAHGLVAWPLATPSVQLLHNNQVSERDLATGALRQLTDGRSAPALPKGALLSYDGARAVWIEGTIRPMLHVASYDGRHRACQAAGDDPTPLAWSSLSELVAYLTKDGSLQFAVAFPAEADWERLVSVFPVVEGLPTMQEVYGFATTTSPIKVRADGRALGTWTETKEGPCLLYVTKAEDGGESLRALSYRRMSARDLGYAPESTTPRAIADQIARSNLMEVYWALTRYAGERKGMLPASQTGPELKTALEDYLWFAGALTTPDRPGEVGIRLLRPGAELEALLEEAQQGRKPIPPEYEEKGIEVADWQRWQREEAGVPLLELQSDDGRLHTLVLTSYGPDIRCSE